MSPFGRAKVKVCAACHGLFVPALQFSFLVNDYLAGVDLGIGAFPPPPPSLPGRPDPKMEPVTCVACRREMDRVQFASRSGAIVDVCNMHGTWLDGGELVPILHFLKTRAELGDVPLSDQEIEDLKQLDQERSRVENHLFYLNLLDAKIRQRAFSGEGDS